MGSSPIGNPSSAGCHSCALPHWGRDRQATPGLCTWLHLLLQPLHTLPEVVSVGSWRLHPFLHRRPWRPRLRCSWGRSRQSTRCEDSARRGLVAQGGSALFHHPRLGGLHGFGAQGMAVIDRAACLSQHMVAPTRTTPVPLPTNKRPLSGHLSRCPEILPCGVHQLSTDISATKTPHYPLVDTAWPEMFVLVLISAHYS
jgi:hypothetical protein